MEKTKELIGFYVFMRMETILSNFMRNRQFPEITREIIRENDVPLSRTYIYIYIYIYVHDFRMGLQSKSAGLSQHQPFRHGPIILDCQMRAMLEKHFSFSFLFAYYSLFGGATCGVFVWNGGLTESTASIHYLHRVLD